MNINVSHVHNVLRTYKHLTTLTPVLNSQLEEVPQSPSGPVFFPALFIDPSDEREHTDQQNAT